MITSVDVCNAIADVIAKLWPDRMIYRDFCSADHQRPSSYLYVTKSGFTDANIDMVCWEMEAELELFCSTDIYDISSTEALRQEQEAVLLAFGAPSLQVGEEWVTLTVQGGGMDMGSAFVGFSAQWFTERPQYHDPDEAAPKMQNVVTTITGVEKRL